MRSEFTESNGFYHRFRRKRLSLIRLPTAIATKGGAGGGGAGSGRPAVANKPSFLTGGAGPASSHLSSKRGTEDLDFFIGDEAISASSGPGW